MSQKRPLLRKQVNKVSPSKNCSGSIKYDKEIRFELIQSDYRGMNGLIGTDLALHI